MSKTESQHAPSPWKTHPASPRKVVDANGAPVASCGRVEKVPDDVYKGYLANARLIAAAPELLHIAKAMNVMGEHIDISQGIRLDQIFAANFKALRAVISKAERQA